MHELSESTKRVLDFGAMTLGVITAVSLNQVAVAVTIVAGLISAAVGSFRLYDRIKYGRGAAS
jgi:hypothetical protein